MDGGDVEGTDDLTSKIQQAEHYFWDYKCTENQYLKKYNFILNYNAKKRLGKFYT